MFWFQPVSFVLVGGLLAYVYWYNRQTDLHSQG